MSERSERHQHELDRIRSVYERRKETDGDRYNPERPVNRFARRGQKRALLWAMDQLSLASLRGQRIVDVGCGEGNWFAWFLDQGIRPTELAGIELDPERAAACQSRYPECEIQVADAAKLPWPDDFFDLAFQSTVFSSILDPTVRRAVAQEMRRVVRDGGAILSYDFHIRKPGNRDVLAIGHDELASLFPDSEIEALRVTLARPLAALFAPNAWPLARALEATKLLNTHYFTVIRPRLSS